jgi:ABC-2 type transport system permease protein
VSLSRLWTVCRLDLLHYLRRPLFWIWLLIVAFCAFGLSTGKLTIQTGDSATGGQQGHITSAFANAFELTMLGALFYTFFVAVAAGMELIRDREQRIESLLHSTPLRPSEYVWGKFGAAMLVSFTVLGVQLALTMLLKHQVTAESQPELIGSWALLNYLQPALLFALPLALFSGGVAFAIGERTRRPVLVNLFPLATLLLSMFLFWMWTPAWLDPRIDRALCLIDPTGFRWLNETWLKVDRGADFYNQSLIGFDLAFYASRVAFALIGLVAVFLSQRHLARSLRGTPVNARQVDRALTRTAPDSPRRFDRPAPLAELRMRSRRPSFIAATLRTAMVELKILRNHPGVWLFLPLIVLDSMFDALYSTGAFDSPLLLIPGRSAVGSLDELTFTLLLFLMVFTVEGLRRDESANISKITYAAPTSTRAIVLGKLLASSLLALIPMALVFAVCAAVLVSQGQVELDPKPYLLVYGLLLFPVILIWNAFLALLFAVTHNRFTTYAISLGVLIGTGIQLGLGNMSWTWNWTLVGALSWTDMGPFELDRVPLILNRLMILTAALLFFIVAVRIFPRRQFDTTRILLRLKPGALTRTTLRLSPWILMPLILGISLQKGVNAGTEGVRNERALKDYWRKNLRSWLDSPNPELVDAQFELELKPAERWLHSQGEYTLQNPHEDPMPMFALTGAPGWESVSWTLDGEAFEPRDDEGLYVFTLDEALATGDECTVGFDFEYTHPEGFSKNGTRMGQFITESSVVLTSFTPDFSPIIGYVEGVGVDKENRYDTREYRADFFEGRTEPAFGPSVPHPVRITVTAPEQYRVNSVGVLIDDTVVDGLRTVRWQSDEPVRFFNVIAGLWDVHRGKGTAIYHHPAHTYNLDEMTLALEGARRFYSEWFHPFPWEELKLSEFPDYSGYAQGFPTNITFSESVGFLTLDDEDSNVAFTVTAHESAHQWWGNILMPGKGPGGNLLSEGTSEFSTMMLTEQVKGLEARIAFCKRLEALYGEGRLADSERELVKVDGSKKGDQVLTYNKMGWACWMLHNHLGKEQSLAGLRAFFDEYARSRDHPVIQDYLLHMRKFASDTGAFDDFVEQWFFEVVLPEYVIHEARVEAGVVHFTLENKGTSSMPVQLAVERGTRFADEDDDTPDAEAFEDARTTVVLGPEESVEVAIPCDFDPQRILVDPDAMVLQAGRKRAIHRF